MTPEMHARLQGINPDQQHQDLLTVALAHAVPLWIEEVRPWTVEQRCARAHDASALISLGQECDELRGRHGNGPAHFVNRNPSGDGEVFNALAMGLALLSYLPGGITYLGLHWETQP